MKKFKDLAEDINVSRVSIGRIIKREGYEVESIYDNVSRKIVKVISDEDAAKLVEKYKAEY